MMPPPAEALQAAGNDQRGHARGDRAQHRADHEQAERGNDHDAAAIDVAQRAEHRRHCGRGEQIGRDHPGQVGDIVKLAPDRRQRGRDDGLVERGQEHRQHQADHDGADFVRIERCRGRQRRRAVQFDHLAREVRQLCGNVVRQRLLVGRKTALPFILVHWGVMLLRGRGPRWNHSLIRNLCSNSLLRQAPQRMGASHGTVLAVT
ncbi:hypothetical protein ACVIHD_002804 [Bradyrhizobium embrapense]